MPIVLDASGYSTERLREMLADGLEGLNGLLEWVRAPVAAVKEPLSLRTAEDLLLAAIAETRTLTQGEADPVRLAAAVNLAYEVQLAAIDIVKMHLDMPKVPRGPA